MTERKDYSDIINMERPEPIRPKMDLGNRAKLFSSFDALRGFDLALLMDDAQELLNRKLRMVRPGDQVTVTYFQLAKVIGGQEVGAYVTESGEVEEVDPETGTLFLDHASILIPDIVRIGNRKDGELYADPA